MDELNQRYFDSLLERARNSSPESRAPLKLFDPRAESSREKRLAYSSAVAPPELFKQIPVTSYESLRIGKTSALARGCCLWIKKMQAGTGSSVERKTFLAKMRGVRPEEVVLGAKGTDLAIPLKRGSEARFVSLAEIQLLQAMHDYREQSVGEVVVHDLVSHETEHSIDSLWNLPVWSEPEKTYRQVFSEDRKLARSGKTIQALMPTLDEQGKQSTNRKAPGGHALFAVDALRAAYLTQQLPKTELNLVSVIGNGEDLSSAPDAPMIGHMIAHQIPIIMVTTDKTPIDLKGGQISLICEPGGETYVSIVEQAQAKEAGQIELFEQLGIDPSLTLRPALFNTNMALFNYAELCPRITKLVSLIGEAEFLKIAAPDLISNWKQQIDSDGVSRRYLQLEGAMGSSLLNLDRYWRKHFREPLVHFINVERAHRSRFFSPIKTAFDFFIQFHSDRFRLDENTMRLHNLCPARLLSATFADPWYADITHVMSAFQKTGLKELEELRVEGLVDFSGVTLKGKVRVKYGGAGLGQLRAHVSRLDNEEFSF